MDPYERTDWCEECGETFGDCGCDELQVERAVPTTFGGVFETRIGDAGYRVEVYALGGGSAWQDFLVYALCGEYLGKAMVAGGHAATECVVGRNAPRSTILSVLEHVGVVH